MIIASRKAFLNFCVVEMSGLTVEPLSDLSHTEGQNRENINQACSKLQTSTKSPRLVR